MLDLLLKNASLVDGTGAPARQADIAVAGGRIVRVGAIDEGATTTIDLDGLTLCPGFVDVHTHYDAQAFWDPTLSPSPLHGVTTVIGGNCGFSIAPLCDDAAEYLMRMLARVEGMPLTSLETGVPWNWQTFGDYLGALEGTLSVNAGFLVGHSALRRVVMGDAAVGEAASVIEIDTMVDLLRQSLAAGGLGFSSSWAPTHHDGDGDPVPSRHASREELLTLCRAVGEFPGTSLEFIPTVGLFHDDEIEIMSSMSAVADRPLNWNVLQVNSYNPDMARQQLAASDYALAHGGMVIALTLPQVMTLRLNLRSGFVFDALPGWSKVLGLPLDERRRALADAEVRRDLAAKAQSPEAGLFKFFAQWDKLVIDETFAEANRGYLGRTVGEVATLLGKTPFDTFLDLSLSEDLRTSFQPQMPGDDDASWRLRAETWRNPRTLIGASDAGAHLDMIDTFTYSTTLLARGVREKGLLTLEEAIHHLSDRPARLYGLRGRGRIAEGWHADLVAFDPQRVGPGPVHTRHDLPGGAPRLFAEALGIEHVFVGGHEIVRRGVFTEARPGTILRSGRDTATVHAAGKKEA